MSSKPGRRAAARAPRRRLGSPLAWVAMATVAVTAGALALQAQPAEPGDSGSRAPEVAPLQVLDLACPRAIGDRQTITVASLAGDGEGDGAVVARADGDASGEPTALRAGASTTVEGEPVTFLRGTDALAPGLVAARAGTARGLAAGECLAPGGERWYVGAAAGGLRGSVLTLANPDPRTAVVDLEIWSDQGPISSPLIRGISVEGAGTRRIELAEVVPQRGDLAVRLLPRQGRVIPSMSDTLEAAGDGRRSDWIAATAAPAETLLLPATPGRSSATTLVLTNPGASAGRAKVSVIGAESEAVPVELEEISVPAGRVVSVELTEQIAELVRSGETTLAVRSTVPVAGSLRALVDDDLVHLAALPESAGPSGAVLPEGERNRVLVLTATRRAGAVTVHFVGGDAWQGRLRPQQSVRVKVPADATAAWVETSAPHVGAVRVSSDDGVAWLGLRELALERRVPSVSPAVSPASSR